MPKSLFLLLSVLLGASGAATSSHAADLVPPTAAIVSPADGSYVNSLPVITGTAWDDVAVSSLVISVFRTSDGLFWDGSAWAASRTWLNASVAVSTWAYSAVPSWVTGSTYTVNARAMDSSGNWTAAYSTSTFVYGAGSGFTGNFSQPGGALFDAGNEAEAEAVAVDQLSAGGPYVLVSGRFWNGTDYDILTVRYNSAGVVASSAVFSGGDHERANAAAVDASGNVYVAGSLSSAGKYLVLKYDAALVLQASATYAGGYTGYADDVALGVGGVYVTGGIYDGAAESCVTARYSTDLALISTSVFAGGACSGVAVTPGGVYVARAGGPYVAVKYDTGLVFQSSAALSRATTDYALDIAAGPDGSVYLTGQAYVDPNSSYLTVKYDANLSLQATAFLAGLGGNDGGSALVTDAGGNVYVAGVSSGTSHDFGIIKYGPDLALRSSVTYDAGTDDRAYDVAVGADGYVYAAGMSQDSSHQIFRTIRRLLPDPPPAFSHYLVDPSTASDVPAGSLLAPGQRMLTAQLADQYGGSVSSAGVPCYISVTEVYGATGTLKYQSGGNWLSLGVSTLVYTDAFGRIGVSTPLSYAVSSLAGDWARVWIGTAPFDAGTYAGFAASSRNVSGKLTTVGGTPSKLVFVSSQPAAYVGINEVMSVIPGAAFTVRRLDDFDNATSQGETIVYTGLPAAQQAVHTGLGKSLGTFGNVGDYGFRDAAHSQFVSAVTISPGQTQASFRYHDRTASYSGVSPAANTNEGGRPGYWQLEARSGSLQPAIHQLRMDPAEVAGVGFANSPRVLVAGSVTDTLGDPQFFRAELRDIFNNPAIATAAVQVVFSTFTRQASPINDSFSFSISSSLSGAFPPVFSAPVTSLTIPLGTHGATFYYLDTTASSVYSSSSSVIRPILMLSVPAREAWSGSTQSVTVLPDFTYRMAVSGVQALTAGTTSQAFTLSISDRYGNPTTVTPDMEDVPAAGVAFSLDSDSSGDVKFASPYPSGFVSKPGSAKLSLGESSTTFYLIDTMVSASTHQLLINTSQPKGWLPAVASYSVTSAAFDHLEFFTSPRRLVAGTTVQYSNYSLGLTAPSVVTVVLKDSFGSVTTASSTVNVRFSAVRPTTYGGLDPASEVVSSNPNWKLLKTSPLDVSILTGQSYASVYVWDSLVGTAPVSASTSDLRVSSASQDQIITPGAASHFTLHHNYTLSSPLVSGTTGAIILRARDVFGNVAAGDAVNGQYYTGKVLLSNNSSGGASLRETTTGATSYIFSPADAGERQLALYGTSVGTLKVSVTDYYAPAVYGYTSDGSRGLPVPSGNDIVQSGMVVTPQDLSPEDPLPVGKTSIGISRYAIYQGDGMLPDSPTPVPMLRLTMQTLPMGAPPAYLGSVRVRSTGTLAYSDIAWIGLYADSPVSGQLGSFDGETVPGGAPVDIFMSSGTYDPGFGGWKFEDLVVKVSTAAIVSNTPRQFFFAVRMSSSAAVPRSFGLVMDSPSYAVLQSTLIATASNNFPVVTATSPVRGQPATVHVQGTNIGAWWQPPLAAAGQYGYVDQGTARAGFLALKVWTDYNFAGTIRSLKIGKTGTGSGADLKSVRLYLDAIGGDPDLGDGVFEPAVDKEITDPVNPPVFDAGDPGNFTLDLYNPGVDGLVNGSTRTFFVAYEIAPDAVPGATHGARLDVSGVALLDGVVAAFSSVVSSGVPVQATQDTVYLAEVNKAAPNDFSKPSFVTQNDVNRPVARLTMQISGGQGSAVWRGLKLDRWVTAADNGNADIWNKVTDVKKINVWYDSNGDGLLQATDTVKDTEVLLTSTVTRTFPYSALRVSLVSTDTVLRVNEIQAFFPADSPFPMAPGRLIINDGQADPALKEVVYYSSVDVINNAFGGLTRGAEGTTAATWSSGTVVSGQAVLPFSGANGGLAISTAAKDYFVAYDISPLAYVSNFSYLGLAIRATDYFFIDAPKLMSAVNIGVTAPGKTLSLIGRVSEYPDAVSVVATDTVTGATLRQQAVNQPIIAFTVQASTADAMLRWLLVYATGSVVSEGTAANDVSLVKIWHDRDNNGLLGGSDVLVGSGTFGNTIYGPLVSKVSFTSEQRVISSGEAAASSAGQRYIVTYDIKSSAMPFDGAGLPRYIGAYLKAESFPQNSPMADNAAQNALSLPNYFSSASSNLTYTSRVREIVVAPSTVTVIAEPVFSPGGAGSAQAVRLAQNVVTAGASDAQWLVTSTAGLASSGYALAGGEIIRYSGTSAGALTGVTRGAFGSQISTHTSGSVLGGMAIQGGRNYPFLKLTLSTPVYGVRWSKLILTRSQPAGLNGSDADSELKIWKDNGNGVFDREAATGFNFTDTLIGMGGFGQTDPAGRATVYVADPALAGQEYMVLGATPSVVFITMDADPEAGFSHEQAVPPNSVLGVEVSSGGSFGFVPYNSGNVAQLAVPAVGPVSVLMPEQNVVTVVPVDISSPTVTQSDKNIGVLALRMSVDKTSARITRLRLNRIGTAGDAAIERINVWRDANANCAFDAADTTGTSGNYPNLLSYGNEVYSAGVADIVLRIPMAVTTVSACAFVSYDISLLAQGGASAGVSIASAAAFGVSVPNSVAMSTWPTASSLMTVQELPVTVTLGVNDVAADLVSAGGVVQSQVKVPLLRFNLAADSGIASVSAIKLRRTGASNDPNAPFGRNTDVKFASIYQDTNRNDILDAADINVSGALTSQAGHFASTDTVPFQLVVESSAGFPSSGNLYLAEAELVSYSGSGISLSGKPYLNITSRAGILGGVNTPALTHGPQASVRKVDLFDQVNSLNTQLQVTLSREQEISTRAKAYFVVYDVAEAAIKANKIGVSIFDKSWISVNSPHEVSAGVRIGVTDGQPQGTSADVYPVSSSLVPVKAVTLSVSGTRAAPLAAEKSAANLPMLTFRLSTLSDYVTLGRINISQTGSIEGVAEGYGDGDLAAVSLWMDDGDGTFNHLRDTRIGYAVHSATNPFEGGIPVDISYGGLPYLRISTSPVTLHLGCDTGTGPDLFGGDIIGHQVGLSLPDFASLRGPGGSPLAASQGNSDSYPIYSGLMDISPGLIQLTPLHSALTIASNGYPAYAVLDSSGNVVRDGNNLPVPDASRWIYGYTASGCGAGEPLIDLNGDGRPENFDYYSSGKCRNISLTNSGKPSFDLDGDRIIDLDINLDHIPDRIVDDGYGRPLYFLGDRVNNSSVLYAISDLGAVPSAWHSSSVDIPAWWSPASALVNSYELSLGQNFSDPTGVKNAWQSAGASLSGSVTGVALSPGRVTRLASRIDLLSASFTVDSTDGFAQEGIVYVGSEIMLVSKQDSSTFRIVERGVQGSRLGPHTAWGETVSDRGYVASVRGVMGDGTIVPGDSGRPLALYRIDTTYPSVPGAPQPQVAPGMAAGQAYSLKWLISSDNESGVASYEIQEREGMVGEWRHMSALPGFMAGGAANSIYTVGDPAIPGEAPRPLGKCYMYRARAWNFAGSHSDWSAISAPACTTIVEPYLQTPPISSGTAMGVGAILWGWGPVNGAAGYMVLGSTGGVLSGALSSATFSWLESGLSTNTAYTRFVQAYNSLSTVISTVTAYTRAVPPSGLAVSQVAVSSAVFTWELGGNPAGTVSQLMRSRTVEDFTGVYEGAGLTFTDATLQECSKYFFKVRGRNGDGVYSGYSSTVSFTTQASTPTPPTGLYAEALTGAKIALTWDFSPSSGVTQYRLYYDNGSGTMDYSVPFMVFSPGVSSWVTPEMEAGKTYKFALRARNRCGIEETNTTVAASAQAVGVLSGVRAAIKSPQTGKKIKGNSVTIVAEIMLGLPSQIKQVRFQYRLQGNAGWADITAANANHPNPDLAGPYFVHWDADSMPAGIYEVRALATDIYNVEDPAPPTITLVMAPVEYDINETVVAGQLQQEQQINNAVTNTVQTADEATALLTKLVIPAGAVDAATAAVTMVANPDSTPAPPEGSEDLNLTVKINLSGGQSQLAGGSAAAVTVNYKDDNNDGIVDGSNAPVERLKMYTSSDNGTTWTEIPTSVDREKKTVTGLTTHFSFFSVFAAPSSTLGGIKAYPNPWQPGAGGRFDAAGVTFSNVPTGARIKIFTILGELVRQLEVAAADTNTKVWDGRNTEGHKAASGVYIVLVKSGSSDRTFKLAVER